MTTDATAPEFGKPEQAIQDSGPSIWIRGLYMLLFIIITRLTGVIVGLVMLIQFILKLATGNTNSNLERFGDQLSQYLYEIVQFQTFNTENKPFPFDQWPQGSSLNK